MMAPETRMKFSGLLGGLTNFLIYILTAITGWMLVNIIDMKTEQAVILTRLEREMDTKKDVECLQKTVDYLNIEFQKLLTQHRMNYNNEYKNR